MALYIISYDVRSENHDYSSLIDRLNELGAVKSLLSVWFFAGLAGQARPLAKDLSRHVINGDSLLVQEAGDDAGWTSLMIDDKTMNALRSRARF